MKTRGSAYILVLVMTASMLLMLAIAANTTNYQAQVSKAYGNYSSLSLMASMGAERAVYGINTKLREHTAKISKTAAANMAGDSEYIPLFLEKADQIIKPLFVNTKIEYELTLNGESYVVSVIITDGGRGFNLEAKASGANGAETVTALAVCAADGHMVSSISGAYIITGEIGYRIENLKQNR